MSLLHQTIEATVQTLQMVGVASFSAILTGLALGVVLWGTGPRGSFSCRWFHQVLGVVVNITRSVPFIILIVALLPLTRAVVGTSIGTRAAMLPLAITACAFYARVAETAFSEVAWGLIEAANSMGATSWQIITKVLLPESMASLLQGATLTVIALIGYSAMAGVVGGGGLGQLAIEYGYQRFNSTVMLETVIILVVMVQLVQWAGDWCSRQRRQTGLKWGVVVALVLCVASSGWQKLHSDHEPVLRVGIVGSSSAEVMQVAKRVALKRYSLHLQIKSFEDYVLPNTALANGDIDANIFQHIPYLDAQKRMHGYHISPIAKTFVYPMGFYSRHLHDIKNLRAGSLVAIPDDPSNQGRALRLLAKYHVIKLRTGIGLLATVHDIVANPLHLRFKSIDAGQIPRVLPDVAMGAVTNDFVAPAGLRVDQAIIKEGPHAPYANVIVVRDKDRKKAVFQELIAAMHSAAVVRKTDILYPHHGAMIAWSQQRMHHKSSQKQRTSDVKHHQQA